MILSRRCGWKGAAAWLLMLGCGATHAADPQPAPPAMVADVDPKRVEAARHLVDVMLPPGDRDKLYADTINAMMRNMLNGIVEAQNLGALLKDEPEMRDIFNRFVDRQRVLAITDLHDHLPELITAQANAFARHFTLDELGQLTVFFGQPIGRKYLAESPAVLADPEMAAWQKDVAVRAQKRLPAELQSLFNEINAAKARESKSHGS